jgi:hypothetical protein
MRARIQFITSVLTFLIGSALFAGCNIFSFAGDEEKPPIEKAEQAIRDGDYDQAIKDLTNPATGALIDSTNSMVLYTYSKAILLQSGLNIAKIIDLIQSDKGSQIGTGNLSLLTELDQMGSAKETTWYKANLEITHNLMPIWNNTARGNLKKTDIALDYAAASIISGVLSLRDTNGDGIINSNDFKIDIKKNVNSGGYMCTGGTLSDGTVFRGLTPFLGKTGKIAGTVEGVAGYTPDDINSLVNTFLNLLETGEESVVYMIQNSTNSTFDIEEVRKFVHEISSIINYYWYDDGIDNDGDGRIDEEVIDGIDNDGDGFIDEDSKYNPIDPTNQRNTQYIPMWEKWKNVTP